VPRRSGAGAGTPGSADGLALVRMGLDVLEDVGVGLLLPGGELVPVGDVGGLGIGEVLVDLTDPAEGDEAALLGAGELGGGAVGGFDEGADLVVDGGRAGALPFGRLFPGGDVGGLGIAGVVLAHSGDPRLAEETSAICVLAQGSLLTVSSGIGVVVAGESRR